MESCVRSVVASRVISPPPREGGEGSRHTLPETPPKKFPARPCFQPLLSRSSLNHFGRFSTMRCSIHQVFERHLSCFPLTFLLLKTSRRSMLLFFFQKKARHLSRCINHYPARHRQDHYYSLYGQYSHERDTLLLLTGIFLRVRVPAC